MVSSAQIKAVVVARTSSILVIMLNRRRSA